MKHLKNINELYKSTYHRVASKLANKHPRRSKEIMDWANSKGTSEFSKNSAERSYPHPFIFTNNKNTKEHHKKSLMGKFFITNAEYQTRIRSEFSGVVVYMMNDWGQKIRITLTWNKTDEWVVLSLVTNIDSSNLDSKEIKPFLFDNRVDARHFLRFVSEWLQDEGDHIKPSMTINDLYYTE